MSPEDSGQISPQRILSLYATPIFVEDEFWGFVGFDDCLHGREFSDVETTILRSTGRLIGNAFYRYEAERERQRMVDRINQRDGLLRAANKASALLLDVNAGSFEDSLGQSMQVIAEAVDVHRVGIWKNFVKDGRKHYFLLQEWSSERRPPVTDDYVKEVPYDGFLHGLYEQLSQREDYADRVSDMPPEDLAQITPQRILSLYATPIFVEDEFWGFVGFDDCLNERIFTENEAMILRATGRFIGNAFYRHEMEREITETRKRYDRMLDASPIGSTLWRQDLTVMDCSEANVSLYGVKNKQEYIDTFHTLSPEYQPNGKRSDEEAKRYVDVAFAEGRVVFEWMHRRPDGTPLPAEVTLVRVNHDDGYAVVGYTRDLREHKRMMAEIEEKNELVRVMFENAPVGLTIFDENFKCIDCNETVLKVFGVTKEFYLDYFGSASHSPLCQPDGSNSREKALEVIGRAMNGETLTVEWVHCTPDGKPLPVDLTLTRAKFGDKNIVLGYVYDMREQSRLREEIKAALIEAKEKSELIRVMFENVPVGLTLFDDNFKCIDCNETVLKIYGVTKEFYTNFFGSESHSPQYQPDGSNSNEKAMAVISRVMNGETMTVEWVHCMPNGDHLPVDLTMTRAKYGDGYIMLGYIYDMREQTRLKEEIKAALIEAKDANRAKSEFLSHISHEIRTPMNAILGASEIQLQKESLPKDMEEAFNTIYNSGNLLLNIINDILDISKIEAGRLELVPAKYDIPSLVYDTMQLNLLRYESKPIEFTLTVDANTPLNLFGDELRIKQVLNNVLSNAFKYTESGEIELSVSTETQPNVDNGCILVLRVSDTGQGMDQEQVDKLFEAYTRFNVKSNRNISGTGLGMSITKQLVDLMNGEITVESEPGKGTRFTVRLPQERIGTTVCGADLVESLRKNSFQDMSKSKRIRLMHEHMPYGSVLIVDDVQSNLYVAKGMMLPYGLKIETIISGIEAVRKIKSGNKYDIIFMDHMMPKMDGMEATKIIREMGYTHSIVALTANAVKGQAEVFLANGFDGFISKPIDSRELDAMLNHLVRDKYPREVIDAARLEKGRQKTDHVASPAKKAGINDELAAAAAQDIGSAIAVLEEIFPKINTTDGADIELFTTTVHGMKSALAIIGEVKLSDSAHILEQAGNNKDMDTISTETPGFIDALRSIVDRFKPETITDDTLPAQDDIDFLREKLNEIKTTCEKFNMRAAKMALADLKQKTWTQEINGILDEISANILRGDFKKVVAVAEKMVKG
jgi:PAS domain S-box-containing protein